MWISRKINAVLREKMRSWACCTLFRNAVARYAERNHEKRRLLEQKRIPYIIAPMYRIENIAVTKSVLFHFYVHMRQFIYLIFFRTIIPTKLVQGLMIVSQNTASPWAYSFSVASQSCQAVSKQDSSVTSTNSISG